MIGLSEIYDAAFDRQQFPAMLARLASAFGAQAAYVGWTDADRDAGFQAQYGNDPVWLQRYVETYAQHDVLRPFLQALPEGICEAAFVHLQRPEVRASLFFREYLAPQGIVDNLAVNLIKRPGIMAHFALLRRAPAEPFGAADCDRLSLLVPHLRRAVYIQSHLVRAVDYDSSTQAIASGSASMLLLSAERAVIEIDPPLIALLNVRAGNMLGDTAFGRTVATAIADDAPAALELHVNGDVIPLLCEARTLDWHRFGDLSAGPGPAHAIHVTRLDQPRVIAFDAIGGLYRLTPTELRVLRNAMEYSNLTELGLRLGMAPATARTHLHRIYEKTGTRGFADLSNLSNRFGKVGGGKPMVDVRERDSA